MRRKRNHFSAQDKAIIRYLDLCFEHQEIIDRLNALMIERLSAAIEGQIVDAADLFDVRQEPGE